MKHVVLLGDSIFDNAIYVSGKPDVRAQLQKRLSADWEVTLLAVDGSTTLGIDAQVKRLPADTTHIIVSVGGNDALGNIGVLDFKAQTVASVLVLMSKLGAEFSQRYQTMLEVILSQNRPTALCTIYNPRLPEPSIQQAAETALAFYNDIIIRAAIQHQLPFLDLRFICNEAADFANPIEPSAIGGEKIAAAIQRLLREHDFASSHTQVYV